MNNVHSELVATADRLVVVAASQGGIRAIEVLLEALPSALPAAVVIVLHIPSGQTSLLAEIFRTHSALFVTEATHGERLLTGHVYVAPPGFHTVVVVGGFLNLTSEPKEHFVRPSADPLFVSAATVYRNRAIGVILTGGYGDGSIGVTRLHQLGGRTIAQDEATSEQFSMPRTAIATGCIDSILPLEEIAPHLVKLLSLPILPVH